MAGKRLGELLLEHGLVTGAQLGDALQAQVIFGGRLGTNLVELGYLSESHLAEFLSSQLGLPSVSAAEIDEVSTQALESVSAGTASRYMIFPLELSGRRLRLAMVDPTDLAAIDEISFQTGFTIQPAVAPEVLVVYALEKHYKVPRPTRYLRLDRATESAMLEAHREVIGPAADRAPFPEDRRGSAGPEDRVIDPGEPDEAAGAPTALETATERLVHATQHGQVVEILRDALSRDFARVAIFGIRGRTAVGWLQAGLEGADDRFRRISFELEGGLAVTELARGRAPQLARVGVSATELWLVEAIGASPARELLFLPVTVGEASLLFAVCDARRAASPSTSLAEYARLSRKVGAAVQMLNFRKQLLEA